MNLSDIDVAILCGGQGSRIRDHLPPGLPKCMTDINGMPMIRIVSNYLMDDNRFGQFGTFIFCTGYGASVIESYLSDTYRFAMHGCRRWKFSYEKEPLGTGGAIVNALSIIKSDPFIIVNGDTICYIDFKVLLDNHLQVEFPITVPIDDQCRNVGVYVVTKTAMQIAVSNLGPKFDLDDAVGDFPKAGVLVNWYPTMAKFWDIGTLPGLHKFRTLRENMPVDDKL